MVSFSIFDLQMYTEVCCVNIVKDIFFCYDEKEEGVTK